MTNNKFFKILGHLYNPDFDANGDWSKPYGVKYYCQATSFSYELYSQDEAYNGEPEYKSDVFSFWNESSSMDKIINDIRLNIKKLIKKNKKNDKMHAM